jgi:uncharacterized membrane protein
MNTPSADASHLPAERSDAFWLSVVAAIVVLATSAAGIVFRLGMMWHFISDGVTALALLGVVWELQRQRLRAAVRTAAQIEELLKLLRSAKADLSGAELMKIEGELQRLQIDLLGPAAFQR